jgi:DNA primase
LHMIETEISPQLLNELQRELALFDENLDIALEFAGAHAQLIELTQQKQQGGLLDSLKEKPFASLSAEEREMLKQLTSKKTDASKKTEVS